MKTEVLLWIISGLCGINLVFLNIILRNQKDLWKRANNHGHTIECKNSSCKPKTTGVVLHEN